MSLRNIKNLEGSPRPSDIFQPHMPGVDLFSDMDELFASTWKQLMTKAPGLERGQRSIALLTPGRHLLYAACPSPGSVPPESVEQLKRVLPPDRPLRISVISYTFLAALKQDRDRCIPFLPWLSGLGYIGHNVLVFEGHPSAYASGIRDSDALIIDSGMLPFLQSDWLDVAYKVMRPNPMVFIYNRETLICSQVKPNDNG